MDGHLKQLTNNSYLFAAWDPSWESFNNSYFVIRPSGGVCIIDTGRAEQAGMLRQALLNLGFGPENVEAVLLTHGHPDHTGGAGDFPNAGVYLHPVDWHRLDPSRPPILPLPASGTVEGLKCLHVGVHTPGSTALFDPESRSLFCGDVVCFFGRALSPPEGGMISTDPEIRRHYIQQLAGWAGTPEGRVRFPVAELVRSVRAMRQFPAEYLCTGHGIVLSGGVSLFLDHLAQAMEESRGVAGQKVN